MKAIHLLAQNLLYDISQIAIPWDNMVFLTSFRCPNQVSHVCYQWLNE
jgi:hypothetical protein